jgi:hypothetical protein
MKLDAWAVFWIGFFLYQIANQLYPHGIQP